MDTRLNVSINIHDLYYLPMSMILTSQNVNYSVIDEANVCVAKNEKVDGPLVIPETIENKGLTYKVTAIEPGAFSGCKITSLELPKTIKVIPEDSFAKTHLESLMIPEGITEIGYGAFSGCRSLKRISFPSSLKRISIGEDDSFFKKGTFNECESLTEIIIPEGLIEIGVECFKGCVSLATISLPESIVSIGEKAFSGCTSLKEITLPNGLSKLSQRTFEECTSLKTAALPKALKSIGRYAFGKCYNLSSIDIPASVHTIGPAAFQECYRLENAVFHDGLISIQGNAFALCNSLKTIHIPKTVDSIEDGAFWACFGLRDVLIPKGLKIKKKNVFLDCTNLGTDPEVNIPDETIIEITSDPYECECFINIPEKDLSIFTGEKFLRPDENYFYTNTFFVDWGRFRNATRDKKEVDFNSLFEFPTAVDSGNQDICEALSKLNPGCYALIDKRLMYKSLVEFHIGLHNAPFNKHCMTLLKTGFSGDLRIKKILMSKDSIVPDVLLYYGEEVYGQLFSDMGSQGIIKRFVFVKEQNGRVRFVDEYSY